MATQRSQIYKCNVCGDMVEVIHAGGGTLTCCQQPMVLLPEQTADATKEKHVPVIEPVAGGFKVKVGSVPHPMLDKHFIEWIELVVDGQVHRQYLAPNQAPEALFSVKGTTLSAREYCNVHGLWKS